jgi:hypothetical protein
MTRVLTELAKKLVLYTSRVLCSCEVATARKREIEKGKISLFGSGHPGLG